MVAVFAESLTVFTLCTEAEPQAMPRVLEQFALRSLVPARWTAERRGEVLAIRVEVAELDTEVARVLFARLGQLCGVQEVDMRPPLAKGRLTAA